MIAPGTHCFVIKAQSLNLHLIGRVVTVTGPSTVRPENGLLMYPIDAEWLRAEHPRCYCFAEPSSLLPIAGPDRPLLHARKREPEQA